MTQNADADAKVDEVTKPNKKPKPEPKGQALGNVMEVPELPIVDLPLIGAALNTNHSALNAEIGGYYVPELVLTSAVKQKHRQPVAFQGIVLALLTLSTKFGLAVLRLTVPGAGKNLDGAPTQFPIATNVLVPYTGKSAEAFERYRPWLGVDAAGNRFARVYELVFIPPGRVFGTELSQAEIVQHRLSGAGSLLSPGGMFAPVNLDAVRKAVDALKDEEVVL